MSPAPRTLDLRSMPAASSLLQSGQWFGASQSLLGTNGGLGNNVLRLMPVLLPAFSFTSWVFGIATAGQASCTIRGAIFPHGGWTPANGHVPAASPLYDLGTHLADTQSPTPVTGQTWTIPYAGVWWVGGDVQGAGTTQPVVRTVAAPANVLPIPLTWAGAAPSNGGTAANPQCGLQMASVSGAITSFAATGTAGSVPLPMFKVA